MSVKKKNYGFIVPLLFLMGCAGGGISADQAGNTNPYASDALVQLVPYETLRNLLIESLLLQTDGSTIQFLDNNRVLFGGANGEGQRNNDATALRLKKVAELADIACRETLENNPDRIFPDGTSAELLYTLVRGAPPSDLDRELISNIESVSGFASPEERRHAVCFGVLAGIGTHLQ